MGAELALQIALIEKLKADPALIALLAPGPAIYDAVPQALDSADPDAFPYQTIGEDTVQVDDTDTSLGFSGLVQIHTWSRHRGRKEIKQVQGATYDVLHRGSLNFSGAPDWYLEDMTFESSDSFLDPDGVTRHGVQSFRVKIQPT